MTEKAGAERFERVVPTHRQIGHGRGRIVQVARSRRERRNERLKMNLRGLKAKDEELLRSRPAVALRGVRGVGREFG
jgi:hypothetical protein